MKILLLQINLQCIDCMFLSCHVCPYFRIQTHILSLRRPGIREATWYPASFISMHHCRIVVFFFKAIVKKTRSSVYPRILMNPVVSCRPLNALVSSSYSGCATLTLFSTHLRIEMPHEGLALARGSFSLF